MKQAPLRGLRCFPRESTGSMSGKCGWAFDMANLPDGLTGHNQSAPIRPWPPACAGSAALSAGPSRAAAVSARRRVVLQATNQRR
jgi:hypothetical protein